MVIAPTPPMGWNSWNTFGGEICADLVKETADAFVREGLREAGYRYVVMDDLWENPERAPDGRLLPDPAKFPDGIGPVADAVHERGLKFGIYSCVGTLTCAGMPGSYGHEEEDARTFAAWGVDFLKYDNCYRPEGVESRTLYLRMGQALRATGRPILFSLCNWGQNEPWKWGASVGGHMWRTTGDIVDSWESIERIGFSQADLHSYAGPNRWNDPDMLVVGMYGKGNVAQGGCTDVEYRTHFSLWCLLAAPLMIGCDVRKMTPATKAILTNPEAIAVNQDPLGRQACRVGESWLWGEAWAKPLANGSVAVGLFNRDGEHARRVPFAFESVGIHDRRSCVVRDVWAREDVGAMRAGYTPLVEPHGCAFLTLTPEG